MKKIIIGSRESKLAVAQSNIIIQKLKENSCGYEFELLTMKTTGDKILDKKLDKIGGKGLFVKELDTALIEGKSDLSIHSLKDMPMDIPEQIPILAYSKREDPRDALILPRNTSELDFSKPIGCSSERRILQLKHLYPNAAFKSIRGNVLTRLEKLEQGEFSGIVLACAGLKRLGIANRINRIFTPQELLPAAGQGILAVQGRHDCSYPFLDAIADAESTLAAIAERACIRALDGGCTSPFAAFAEISGVEMTLTGLYYNKRTAEAVKESKTVQLESFNNTKLPDNNTKSREAAQNLGITLANELKRRAI